MTTPGSHWINSLYKFIKTSHLGKLLSIMLTSAIQLVQPVFGVTAYHGRHLSEHLFERNMEDFAAEVRSVLRLPFHIDWLLHMSRQLEAQYRARLSNSAISMLPSYQHTLPSGEERGDFLALDVGGSTFRVALIRLRGRDPTSDPIQTKKLKSWVIDKDVRALKGLAFFDWMACRIGEMLDEYYRPEGSTPTCLDMGLAWSFPIDQTSPRTGNLLPMGKGFLATAGIEGQDLSDIIMAACSKRKLNVRMRAIVNDGAATLLAQAYRDPSTRLSLILGTGTNAAIFLPVTSLGRSKFGRRPAAWHQSAHHVIVNTEMSMFGKNILPTTKWDEELNACHTLPDFQPLEYLITGRYLGEIVRLILLDGITRAGLFGGNVPERLEEPYALDTRIVAGFEIDTSPRFNSASRMFFKAHPLPMPSDLVPLSDLEFVRDVIIMVSDRAAIYLSTAIHALWVLRTAEENLPPDQQASRVAVACNGTIVEKYPFFRERCQRQLDALCIASGASAGAVVLEMAPESSIYGAAVAVSCIDDD